MDCNRYRHCEWIFSDKAATNAVALKKEYEAKLLEELNYRISIPLPGYHPLLGYEPYANALQEKVKDSRLKDLATLRSGADSKLDISQAEYIQRFITDDKGVISFIADDPYISAKIYIGSTREICSFDERLSLAYKDLQELGGPFETLASEMTDLVLPVIPVNHQPGVRFLFSTHKIKGVIFAHYDQDFDEYRPMDAIDIFHEIGHQVLMYYLLADEVILSDPNTLVYSGARKVARPAFRSLHSAMALTYMQVATEAFIEASKFEKEKVFLRKKHELYRSSLAENLKSLREKCAFSEFGKILMAEMETINSF